MHVSDADRVLRELHATLERRKRPEDVAELIRDLHAALGGTLDPVAARALAKAAEYSLRNLWHGYTSMSEEFARPVGAARQLAAAAQLFPELPEIPAEAADDPARIAELIRAAGRQIGRQDGQDDFGLDRLDRAGRAAAGLGDLSARRYNKRFRLLLRLEAKLVRLIHEQRRREVTLTGKGALAARLPYDLFAADPDTAAFIAYRTARGHQRSVFTNGPQRRVHDEVGEALLERLREHPDRTCWYALAHVHPTAEVLARLSDAEIKQLLVRWNGVLRDAAAMLEAAWRRQPIERATMVVRRGQDSSTWNQAAQCWNTARDHWFALVFELGEERVLDVYCPGKVPRLMAADVAAWHRRSGGGLHPDTLVWAELPLPWEVLRGERTCPRTLVEDVCARHRVDPVDTAWTAPRRPARPAAFRRTPELVHGVAVSDPLVAGLLRSAGTYSGKAGRAALAEWL
ncbi:hypothetical protein AB0K51_07440 [Kitasatospora sp. NPDC049285]|uniref:hypothetical protein n=1 Tax=Kitasatospora sp. NPDC049285 TaxID=3157096 RepID=UPI00343902A3